MSEDVSDTSPKRKKKQMWVLSDSESDDEGPSQVRQQTRKHLRVSDDESSDSSVGAVRRSQLQPLPASSASEDSHDDADNAASDSSDGNSDRCPICLARLGGQLLGVPENCEHMFCAECIIEWARNVNTCPVDRLMFLTILVIEGVGRRLVTTRSVDQPKEQPADDIEEDVTRCQVCNSGDDEAMMLLCDTCDEGFHTWCLSPPLQEIPEGEWHCPSCAPTSVNIAMSNALVARVERHLGRLASASWARRTSQAGSRRRSKPRRRRRAVVTEYEVQQGRKVAVKKVSKRRIKKRKTHRNSARTAARRAAVRATVRERLVSMAALRPSQGSTTAIAAPTLSLFGDRDQLDYFSEEDDGGSGGGDTFVVARRPTASILNAYRQARRKMVTIRTPPTASSTPDLLSDIMESQTLLHSKKSLLTVTVDGKVNIKIQTSENKRNPTIESDNSGRLDLSKTGDSTRKAPSYPGGSRGGNWNGSYRGDGNRGGYGNNNGGRHSYGGGYSGNHGNQSQENSYPYQSNNSDAWSGGLQNPYHDRRPHEYDDDVDYRNRQNLQRPLDHLHRASGYMRSFSDQTQNNPGAHERLAFPVITPRRHTFSSLDQNTAALDMRMAQEPLQLNTGLRATVPDLYGDIEPPRQSMPAQQFDPLPEPPVFRFIPPADVEKSEDEKSDSGLIIDTEKYDPTNPTHDESSGDEAKQEHKNKIDKHIEITLQPSEVTLESQALCDQIPPRPINMSPLNVQTSVLDKAVQQVINEHRNRIGSSPAKPSIVDYKSDDSEGDCPNFSIYSATSVNIANSSELPTSSAQQPEIEYLEKEEDLVQEDDDIPLPEVEIDETKHAETGDKSIISDNSDNIKEQTPQTTYEDRISKKCPITPNKRNPIKIKLHSTQNLIKRNVNLQEDDDKDEESEDQNETGKKGNILGDSCIIDTAKNSISTVKKNDNEMTSSLNFQSNADKRDSGSEENEKCDSPKEDYDVRTSKAGDKIDKGDSNKSDNESEINIIMHNQEPVDKPTDALEKMTESISESEDERSYTPCLDENKSTSFENEKENAGLEGLDTEMISEEEGNDMFSDGENKKAHSDYDSPVSLQKESIQGEEEGEITEKTNNIPSKDSNDDEDNDESKKKKRKDKKGISKDKSKSKNKKSDIAFKKLSKNTKERNYRDKEQSGKTKIKDRKKSDGKENKDKARDKKKEKRKDMERYDVRSVVSEKRRRVKDAFGRDTSRPRSKSPSIQPSLSSAGQRRSTSPGLSRSISRERYTPSLGRRSISRGRKSGSHGRRPVSPRMRKSMSPRNRKLISPVRRRSISPKRRSITPVRRSVSPNLRRSISPRERRLISPRLHRSISPHVKRNFSLRGRSPSPHVRRSISPRPRRKIRRTPSPRKRSLSPRNRRSLSHNRKRLKKSKSPRKKTRRSRSRHKSLSRNRSRTPKAKKRRRTKSRRSPRRKSPKAKKRPSRSITPNVMLSPAIRKQAPPMWRNDNVMYREWSDSRSVHSRLMSPGWTPAREPSPEPQNLRVYLTNKDKIKRKEKKKKSLETEKHSRRLPDTGPSKEVFTSGNNILVSVSFNKDERTLNQEDSGAELGSKKRKRKGESKKDKRERIKKKRNERKKDTENKKPVAIIDLEKSPFMEITPSPKNVIVLSDSDQGEKEDQPVERQQITRNELREIAPTQQDRVNVLVHRETFANLVGPKTPPEPSVKFSIAPKVTTILRPVNPLHEEEEPDDEGHAEPDRPEGVKDGGQKGPNTPPDPPNTPPSSPDAYDPFEPTKSGSATPEPEPTRDIEPKDQPHEKTTITLETAQKTNLSADDVVDQRPITPIEKVMALLQSTRNVSPIAVDDEPCSDRMPDLEVNGGAGTSPERPASVANSGTSGYHTAGIPRIGVYNSVASPRTNSNSQQASNQRIVLPSPSKSSPLKNQPTKLFLAKPSPIKSTPIKPMPSKTLLKLPLPSVKPLPGRREIELSDSPYSPGSSDFGDLFEPPSDATKSYSKSGGNADIFDSLFGSKPKKSKSSATKVPVKQIKQKGKTQVGVKIDENNLKILDDLPSSAVEMQVKSKFLKKLNRQERVVEEVKLVLKPHYNKKHVTKEQYKDILRKAVPKICHNKTGEINPSKIQSLVEAYVKKFRVKNKQT